jgi:hypothetical protein
MHRIVHHPYSSEGMTPATMLDYAVEHLGIQKGYAETVKAVLAAADPESMIDPDYKGHDPEKIVLAWRMLYASIDRADFDARMESAFVDRD